MKKILFLFLSAILCMNINAQTLQTDVKDSKWYDNAFIGVYGGGSWSLQNHHQTNAFWPNINPMATIKFGKYFNPNIGAQIELEGGFSELGKTVVDHTMLGVDALFNFSNIFGGYKGEPRNWEFVGVLGTGWFHTYDYVSNSVAVKGGVEINWNFDKKKAWQLNIIPAYTYLPDKAIDHSYVSLSVGVTYKFKNSNGTHNFKFINVIDPVEYDALNQKINDLRAANQLLTDSLAKAEAVHDTVYINVKEVSPTLSNVVSFQISKYEVDEVQMANLSYIAETMKSDTTLNIVLKGYADKNTGTASYNKSLSVKRAEAVKDVLVNTFGIDDSRIETEGLGDTEQPYTENNWNRVVLFFKK